MDEHGHTPDDASGELMPDEGHGPAAALRTALLPVVFALTAAVIIAIVAASGTAAPAATSSPRGAVEGAAIGSAPGAAEVGPTSTETPAPIVSDAGDAADDGGVPPPNASTAPWPSPPVSDAPPGTRDKRLWPFAADSIWNLPIGRSAVYVPAGLAPASAMSIDEEYFVFPSPSDPMRPFYTNGVWGTGRCSAKIFRYNINLPDSFVVNDAQGRVTPNAVAAILAADGRTLKQMNPLSRCQPGGPLTAGWMAPDQDIYGAGILGAHGGSGLSSIGGSIRRGELTGPDPIRHVLKVNLWGRRWLSQAASGHRWPAVTADSFFDSADNPEAYGGQLPQLRMGSLLALPPYIDVDALGLATPAAKKLAWTLQNYGAYVVDDTNWDSHAIDVEAGVADEFRDAYGYNIEASSGAWYQDMMRIFGLLAVIDNNRPHSIGGGGIPRQWLAPPIGN